MTDAVKKAKENYVKEYMQGAWTEYIAGVAISDVGTVEWLNNGKHGNPIHKNQPCLYVFLRQQLPSNKKLPEVYEGLNVYYQIVGEFHL